MSRHVVKGCAWRDKHTHTHTHQLHMDTWPSGSTSFTKQHFSTNVFVFRFLFVYASCSLYSDPFVFPISVVWVCICVSECLCVIFSNWRHLCLLGWQLALLLGDNDDGTRLLTLWPKLKISNRCVQAALVSLFPFSLHAWKELNVFFLSLLFLSGALSVPTSCWYGLAGDCLS